MIKSRHWLDFQSFHFLLKTLASCWVWYYPEGGDRMWASRLEFNGSLLGL